MLDAGFEVVVAQSPVLFKAGDLQTASRCTSIRDLRGETLSRRRWRPTRRCPSGWMSGSPKRPGIWQLEQLEPRSGAASCSSCIKAFESFDPESETQRDLSGTLLPEHCSYLQDVGKLGAFDLCLLSGSQVRRAAQGRAALRAARALAAPGAAGA